MSSRSVNVRDIFGNIQAKKDAMGDASGADILKSERKIWKPMWPRHKEDNIDKIVKEQAKKGLTYADWQKERYRTKVDFPAEAGVIRVRTFGSEGVSGANKPKYSVKVRPVDDNYDRKRISAE